MSSILRYCLLFYFLSASIVGWSQTDYVLKGKLTDAETGEGLPFVSIYVLKKAYFVSSDFEGNYELKAPFIPGQDTLVATYVGYQTRKKAIPLPQASEEIIIDMQLTPEETTTEEVGLSLKDNPAHRVMRRVIEEKKKNDKRNLLAYEYESYTKTEIGIDNVSEKLQAKKIYQKISAVIDSAKAVAGEDGKPIIPVFISESISNYYHREKPDKTKEKIMATNIKGVAISDGSLSSQLVGSTFQEYNFYKNWLNILNKDFISPLADGWQTFYRYYIVDTTLLDGYTCYKLEVVPRQKGDLAFKGFIWITDSSYALKQIDVKIGKEANINFIEKIKIQQELVPTKDSAWLPSKTRVLVDVSEITNNSAGVIAKFYVSNKNIVTNAPKPEKFYDQLIEVDEESGLKKGEYWSQARHDTLTISEQNVYNMIDTIKSLPAVKTYVEILNILVNGYKKVGKIDIGPYLSAFTYNDVEGIRPSLGFRTNIDFSRKLILKGYAAYGFRDREIKYALSGDVILDRKPWTVIGIEHNHDIEQVAINSDNLQNNALFLAFSRWLILRGPYFNTQNTFRFQTDVMKGWTQKMVLRTRDFDALYSFAYYKDLPAGDSSLVSRFQSTELILETKLSRDELYIQNDNDRISMGALKWPILTIKNTFGLNNVLGSDFSYYKVQATVTDNFRMGAFGRSYYDLQLGKVFGNLPYPLYEVHIGNQSYFYSTGAFNLMNYFEFISDTYATLRYRHYVDGLFFNRIPAIKRWKWRFLVTSSMAYGALHANSYSNLPPTDAQGRTQEAFYAFSPSKPYIEVGYGVENIFRVLRVDFFHRLTYLDHPGVRRFGVKFSFQFSL